MIPSLVSQANRSAGRIIGLCMATFRPSQSAGKLSHFAQHGVTSTHCFFLALILTTRQSAWVETVASRMGKTRIKRKTANKICPLRFAMGTPLFQLRYRSNSRTLLCTKFFPAKRNLFLNYFAEKKIRKKRAKIYFKNSRIVDAQRTDKQTREFFCNFTHRKSLFIFFSFNLSNLSLLIGIGSLMRKFHEKRITREIYETRNL